MVSSTSAKEADGRISLFSDAAAGRAEGETVLGLLTPGVSTFVIVSSRDVMREDPSLNDVVQ